MATRSFKRDSKGRFAVSAASGGARGKKLSAEQKAARNAEQEVKELKEQRAVQSADELVKDTAAAIKTAEREYKQAQKAGTDDALDSAWAKRIKAHQQYAAALRRRARAGQ